LLWVCVCAGVIHRNNRQSMDSEAASSPLDQVDPATGLSQREKQDIRHVWSLVSQDLESAGMGFFLAYFKAHPEYQSKFKAFAKVPMDELKDNRSFQMHAMNVMNAITLIVDTLENPEELVSGLKEMGVNHRKRRIEAIHFHNLAAVLLAFLQSALGSAFTEQAQKSWSKAMGVIISTIMTTLEN